MRYAYSLATSTVTHNLQEGSDHDHSSSLLCLSVSKSCLTYHRYLKCEQLINKWSSKTTATTTKAIQSKNKSVRAASAALSAAVLTRPEVRSRKSASLWLRSLQLYRLSAPCPWWRLLVLERREHDTDVAEHSAALNSLHFDQLWLLCSRYLLCKKLLWWCSYRAAHIYRNGNASLEGSLT